MTPKDLLMVEGPCTILVSEAQMWFSSLIPVTNPIYHAVQAILVRARRREWDLVLDTQRFRNLNNRLRNITHYIMCPSPFPVHTWNNPSIFEVDLWDYNTDELLNTFYYPLESVADIYKTKEEPYGFEAYFREVSKMLDGYELVDFYAPSKRLKKRMSERGISWENEELIKKPRQYSGVEAIT